LVLNLRKSTVEVTHASTHARARERVLMLTRRAEKTEVGSRDLALGDAGERRRVLLPARTKQRRGRGLGHVEALEGTSSWSSRGLGCGT